MELVYFFMGSALLSASWMMYYLADEPREISLLYHTAYFSLISGLVMVSLGFHALLFL